MRPGMRFIPYRQFVGLFIPNALARCPLLGAHSKLIWGRLAQFAGEDGTCFPKKSTLAYELGCSEKTVWRGIRELCDAGFLESEEQYDATGAQTSNKYYFLWHDIFDPVQPSQGSQTSINTGRTDCPGGEDDLSPPTNCPRRRDNLSLKEIQENTTSSFLSSQVLGWIDQIAPHKDDPESWKAKMLILARAEKLDLDLLQKQANKVNSGSSVNQHEALLTQMVLNGESERLRDFLNKEGKETVSIGGLHFNRFVAQRMLTKIMERRAA